MKLNKKQFLSYKLFNSSFTGLSIGILFTIYEPIKPLFFSLGGIILALGMLIVARYYDSLLNIRSFYKISLVVEVIILLTLLIYLILKQSLFSALIIYCSYQLTFIFGGYLVRAETLVANNKEYIGKIDTNKQIGYLFGLVCSFIFYQLLEVVLKIDNPTIQISILHYILICLQIHIIDLLIKSFKKRRINNC